MITENTTAILLQIVLYVLLIAWIVIRETSLYRTRKRNGNGGGRTAGDIEKSSAKIDAHTEELGLLRTDVEVFKRACELCVKSQDERYGLIQKELTRIWRAVQDLTLALRQRQSVLAEKDDPS